MAFLKPSGKNIPAIVAGDTIAIGGDGDVLPAILEIETALLPTLVAYDTDGKTIQLSNGKPSMFYLMQTHEGRTVPVRYSVSLRISREAIDPAELAEVNRVLAEKEAARAVKAAKQAELDKIRDNRNFSHGLAAADTLATERAKHEREIRDLEASLATLRKLAKS